MFKQIVKGIKNGIEILVGQADFKLWIKQLRYCQGPNTYCLVF